MTGCGSSPSRADTARSAWTAAAEHLRADLRLSKITTPTRDEIIASLTPDGTGWATHRPEGNESSIVQALRFKVKLDFVPGLSRTIEVRDDQTLEDVHAAIQDAFGWDSDHLFAFYSGSRRHDELTEIQRGTIWTGANLPEPDDVTRGDLARRPEQPMHYLFDVGDS